MGGNGTIASPLQFLNSWKEIANYLGKGVRTVQRYEHDFGLPVRRPARRAHGSVIATKIEIDAWLEAMPLREACPLRVGKGDSHLFIVEDLNASVVRMFRLCKEMVALRAELSVTRNELRNSVATLRQELRRRENPPGPPRDEVSGWQEAVPAQGASKRVH